MPRKKNASNQAYLPGLVVVYASLLVRFLSGRIMNGRKKETRTALSEELGEECKKKENY